MITFKDIESERNETLNSPVESIVELNDDDDYGVVI